MPIPNDQNNTAVTRIENIAGIALLVLLVIGVFMVLQPFLTILLWSAIFAFATWPIFNWLNEKVGHRRSLAAFLLTLALTLVLLLPLLAIVSSYADDIPRFLRKIPDWLALGLPPPPSWVVEIPLLGESISATWSQWSQDALQFSDDLKKYLTDALPQFRKILLSGGAALGQGALELALSLLLAFFFYRDGVYIVERITEALEKLTVTRARALLFLVGDTVKRVVNGILGTACAQGILAAIGFLIAGVPGALILGLLTFFLSLIPMGPPLIWLPAALMLLFSGDITWGIFLLLWGAFIVSGIDNVMKPYLISRGGSLPLIIVLLGVFGGLIAFGFIGIFLGPTLLAIAYSLISEWLAPRQSALTSTESTTPSDDDQRDSR